MESDKHNPTNNPVINGDKGKGAEVSADNNTNTIIIEPSDKKREIIYASPRFGINLFMGIIDFALLFLYKEVYLLDPGLVGTALMLGKLSAALFQTIIPWISDHTHTRWGRRKPFIIILAPILAISYFMLLLPGVFLGASPPALTLFGWFITFNVLSQGAYAVTSIYHTWMAEQFRVEERPKISQYQNIFNFLAMGVVTIFSFMVLTDVKDQLKADPTTIPALFLISIIIFVIIMLSLLYTCVFYMPVEPTPIYTSNFKKEWDAIKKNRNFLILTFIQGFSSLAWAMINAVLLGFIDTVIGLESTDMYIAAGLLLLGLFIFVAFWRRQIESMGKKKTLLRIFLVAILGSPFSLLGLFAFSYKNLVVGIGYALLIALMQGGWSLFPYIMYADIAEDDEKKTGELKAGLYTGFPAFVLNIFQALSLQVTGWLLKLPDIVNVPGNVFTLGYVLWGPLSSVIFILTFYFVRKLIKLDFEWERKD